MIDCMVTVKDLPVFISDRITKFNEGLRYISPSDNDDAVMYEKQMIELLFQIQTALPNFKLNQEDIELNLTKLERIYVKRKSTY